MKLQMITLAVVTALLTACGGGGGKNTTTPQSAAVTEPAPLPTPLPTPAPTANAGADVTLKEGHSVTLNGTTTGDKTGLNVRWTQISGPTVSFNGDTSINPSVTAPRIDADTSVVLRLTATDGHGQTGADDVTLFLKNNVLPQSSAGENKSTVEKAAVELNGSGNDTDGKITSYVWRQTEGPYAVLKGTDTLQLSFIAPAVDKETVLSFELTVTDDDGDTNTSKTSVTVTTIQRGLTLIGKATNGTPLANAVITASVDGQRFTTTADAEGHYSLPINVDDDRMSSLVSLSADGVGIQASMKLLSAAGDFFRLRAHAQRNNDKPFDGAEENVSVNSEQVSALNITNVTTAHAVLLEEANNGPLKDQEQFVSAERHLAPQNLMEIAATIKLIADDPNYRLPADVSSVTELVRNKGAYNTFISNIPYQVMQDMVDGITNDPELTPPLAYFDHRDLFFGTSSATPGFLSRYGFSMHFDKTLSDNHQAVGYHLSSEGKAPFTWSRNEEGYNIEYQSAFKSVSYWPVGSYLVQSLGLTEQQVADLANAGYTDVPVNYRTTASKVRRLVDGYVFDVYQETRQEQMQMAPITLGNETIAPDSINYESILNYLMRDDDVTWITHFRADELVGNTWGMNTYYNLPIRDGESKTNITSYYHDRLSFNADGTGAAAKSARGFTWSIDKNNGELIINYTDGIVQKTRIQDRDGPAFGVYTSTEQNGQPISANYDYATKLDSTLVFSTQFLNAENEYWQSFINIWNSSYWSKEKIDFYHHFGFRFDGGNVSNQYTTVNPTGESGLLKPLTRPMAWKLQADGVLRNDFLNDGTACDSDAAATCKYRNWKLLGMTEGKFGQRMLVEEEEWVRSSVDDEFKMSIGTRFNMYERLNRNYWELPKESQSVARKSKLADVSRQHILFPKAVKNLSPR